MTAASPPRVIRLPQTGSTNSEAMARAVAGETLPFWVVADRQTVGRGRAGRAWVSVEGNLLASLAIKLTCRPAVAAQLSLVAGLAVLDAVEVLRAETDADATWRFQLKWPNDILCDGAKCGGILIETSSGATAGVLFAVIGIGLNLLSGPDISGRRTTGLAASGIDATRDHALATLANAMDSRLRLWNEGLGFAAVRQRWLEVGMPIGTAMTVASERGRSEGAFVGLDDDGALLLRNSGGGIERHTFGDVTLASERTAGI